MAGLIARFCALVPSCLWKSEEVAFFERMNRRIPNRLNWIALTLWVALAVPVFAQPEPAPVSGLALLQEYNQEAESHLETNPGKSLEYANKALEAARLSPLPRDAAQRMAIWKEEARANFLAGRAFLALEDKKRAVRYFRTAKIMADQSQDEELSRAINDSLINLGRKPGIETTISTLAESWTVNVDSWVRENQIDKALREKTQEVTLLTQVMIARELERNDPDQARELYENALPKAIEFGDSTRAREIRKRIGYLGIAPEKPPVPERPAYPAIPELPSASSWAYGPGDQYRGTQNHGDNRNSRSYVAVPVAPKPPTLPQPPYRPGSELLKKSESLEKTGDYKASLEALKAYQSLQEAYAQLLYRQEVDSAANELTLRSKIQEIELLREIQELNEEKNERERTLMFVILGGLFAIAMAMAWLFFTKRKAHSQIQKAYSDLDLAHRKLQNAQTQLVTSEKMASLGQLTAGIAHEINNPVNFISGNIAPLRQDVEDVLSLVDAYEEAVRTHHLGDLFASVQQRRDDLDLDYLKEEMASLLRGIEEGASRTTEIVRGLRNFARMDEDDLKTFDVHSGLNSTLILLRNKCENISVVRDYDEIPEIEGLPGKLNQVFMNLLVNSIQSIREKEIQTGIPGGEIRVSTELMAEQNLIKIRFSDTGTGIPDAIRDKIFDPFFTTKDVGEGTGLGLSISLGIVRQHDGRIEVEETSEAGTTLAITLPMAYRGAITRLTRA
jgi:signal transduction histidine kinase